MLCVNFVSSGSPFEPRIDVSPAVKLGQIVAVSGTAPSVMKVDKIGSVYAFIDPPKK